MIHNKKQNIKVEKKWSLTLRFVLPSLIGMILFMFPICTDGKITIPIATVSDWMQTMLEDYISIILLVLTGISFFGSVITAILFRFGKSGFVTKLKSKKGFCSLFKITIGGILIRAFSFLACIFIYYSMGLEMIYSNATGGLVFTELLPILFTVFFLAGFLLPLLLNFGLLEFTGTLLSKIMRPLYGLPGRSAIDAIASWLGDGTIGVLLTSKQYEDGYYTEREASVIGTSFSLVSITFCLVVIKQVNLSDMFIPFYLTVCLACLAAAILVPKLPPLSRKKNKYIDGRDAKDTAEEEKSNCNIKHAYSQAIDHVRGKKVISSVAKDGFSNVINMWIGVIPIVMAMGTAALIVAEYTSFFEILGMPFTPLLKLLRIPEAAEMSRTIFAGFADMLLPSVMIAGVKSDMTRFIVAALSVSQLIYLSEVGALILASKIPVKLWELVVIFIERTLIVLPIITLVAHLLF